MHALSHIGAAAPSRARARGLPLRLCAQAGKQLKPTKLPKQPPAGSALPSEVARALPWDAEFKRHFMENYWQASSRPLPNKLQHVHAQSSLSSPARPPQPVPVCLPPPRAAPTPPHPALCSAPLAPAPPQKRPLLVRGAVPSFRESPISPDELAGIACDRECPSRIIVHDAGNADMPWELVRSPESSPHTAPHPFRRRARRFCFDGVEPRVRRRRSADPSRTRTSAS